MGNKDTSFPKIRSIRIGEKLFDFSQPKIMGVLNLTPDSFYDGGKYNEQEYWVGHTRKMLDEGADIIDLGAVSTRPGAEPISEDVELNRLLAPLKILLAEFPEAVFSIDTYHSGVARQCAKTGAHMINDISGGNFDKKMFPTIADLKIPYVLMHIHGSPKNMQAHPISENVENIIYQFFKEKVAALRLLGVEDIILDPGFGFGKTLKSNYRLLHKIAFIRIDDLPILTGTSRKSLINKVIDTTPSEALNGTTVVNTLALLNGANLLRVHDVKEAREAIDIIQYYRNFGMFSK